VEDRLQLLGWTRPRRVVIIRRRLREGLAIESKRKGAQQLRLALADDALLDAARLWVLRGNLDERRPTIWMRTVSRRSDDARHLIVAGAI